MSTNKNKNKNNKKKRVVVNTQSQPQGHVESKRSSITWPPEGDKVPPVSTTMQVQDQNQKQLNDHSMNTQPDSQHVLSGEQDIQSSTLDSFNRIKPEADTPAALKVTDSSDINATEPLPQKSKEVESKENHEKDVKELSSDANFICLDNRSDQFKAIIEFALKYENLEEEQRILKGKVKKLSDNLKKISEDNKFLTETNKELSSNLEESKELCAERLEEINLLKMDIDDKNEVINIVRADRTESAQEYKNSLGAALKPFHGDYMELKALPMDADIGAAMSQTLDDVFRILNANGIVIE